MMDSQFLDSIVERLGGSGVVLSAENRASLQTSLSVLKNEMQFSKVYFWGRITGTENDYFIAQGVDTRDVFTRRVLYSLDCINWKLLNPATNEMRAQAALITHRFTGDLSHEFEAHSIEEGQLPVPPKARPQIPPKEPGEDDEEEEGGGGTAAVEEEEPEDEPEPLEDEVTTVKEEDRLIATIDRIDHDALIVPRRAYVFAPEGYVRENRGFEGLTDLESMQLSSYLHFRYPEVTPCKSLWERVAGTAVTEPFPERSNYLSLLARAETIDFLDRISDDVPAISWSVQRERGGASVVLRSLYWPGYSFFHMPNTRYFGSVYVGDGRFNVDLPFMM